MNSIQRIVKNVGLSGISQLLISALSFVLMICIARYFGEAEFGIYNFALSFASLFTVFADIGISQLLIRDIARNKKITSEYFTNISIIKIILSVFTLSLIVLTINIMHYPSDIVYIVFVFGIYTVLSSFAQMIMSIFQAFEKMEYVAALTTIEKIIIISLGIFVLFCGYGLLELAYVYVFASIINLIISLIFVLKKITKPLPKINLSLWKTLTIKSLPFGLNSLFALLFFRIDTVFLSILKDEIAVGIYSAAYNPLLVLSTIISGMISSAIYPVMSRYFIYSRDSLENFTILTSKYMAIVGFPIAVGCFVLADKFIGLFYAGQYSNSIVAFQILAVFIPIRLISGVTGTLLTSINKQNIRAFCVCLAAIFNILLNLALIPSLSYLGASIATVLSELLLFIIYLYFANKDYKLKLENHVIKPLIASLIMGALLVYIKGINLLLIIILAILTYFIILILMKTFTSDDKYVLRQILRKD